jgi:hypothetical protein
MTTCQRWQRRILRIVGAAGMLAAVAVFMPFEWMAAIHAYLGMGPLPHEPVVEYLARTASLFYVMLGVLFWLLSRDVPGNRRSITLVAVACVAAGVALVTVDMRGGMPWWWTAAEGPLTVAFGLALLLLQMGAARERAEADAATDDASAEPEAGPADAAPDPSGAQDESGPSRPDISPPHMEPEEPRYG